MDRLIAMETFVCVVESGSFSAAAGLLDVGQPAVSKSVAQLEERLAVRLLLRSTRGANADRKILIRQAHSEPSCLYAIPKFDKVASTLKPRGLLQ